MQTILLHPAHRKMVHLLQDHISSGRHLNITQQDINEFNQLMHRTSIALERHKGIYRILIGVMNRNNELGSIENDLMIINHIENAFAHAERKRPYITIRNIILRPIIFRLMKLFK